MPRRSRLSQVAFAPMLLLAVCTRAALAAPVTIIDSGAYLSATDICCKVKVTLLQQTRPSGGPSAAEFLISADVLEPIKGDPGKAITFTMVDRIPLGPPSMNAGGTYLVFLKSGEPHTLVAQMPITSKTVEPSFGKEPVDRLLAELIATLELPDADLRLAVIRQIGNLRDPRGAKAVAPFADGKDPDYVAAAVCALYRMKVAPDARQVMAVFNAEVLDCWYQESGIAQKDAAGKWIGRRENGILFFERGLPDFDYATYVREGAKLDWIRKDNSTLYTFFGIPWKVQRRECVPELIKLLDDPDLKIRGWAVLCLTHTVENKDEPQPDKYAENEDAHLKKWRTWWKEKGPAYMALKPTRE